MTPWRTAIMASEDGSIRARGYNITDLMRQASFTDVIFLLHQGRLPEARERKLLDAVLVAVADHGAGAPSCATARLVASGNRQSLSAAVAAGILAVGDEHGGAGSLCMEMISAGLDRARAESLTTEAVAELTVKEARAAGKRLPGLGHRVHSTDPRTGILFDMAREQGVAGDGVSFIEALQAAVSVAVKPMPINVDGALAAVFHDLGFQPRAGKLLFLVGRVAGLTAEVDEEYAREKPMRIRIPVEYDGVPPRQAE